MLIYSHLTSCFKTIYVFVYNVFFWVIILIIPEINIINFSSLI